MRDFEYWMRQAERPLFGGIDIEKPEQRRLAGKLMIVGGSASVFFTIAKMTDLAKQLGIGEVRTVLPDVLRKKVPKASLDVLYGESGNSGAFAKGALTILQSAAEWGDIVLMGGDMGRSAETAELMSEYLRRISKPVVLMRDAVDLVMMDAGEWIEKNDILLVLTMVQLQKLLRSIYYPRMVTLKMPLNQLVELLHKLTLSYGIAVMTYHEGQLVAAENGAVVTMAIGQTKWDPISMWGGELEVEIVKLRLWNGGADWLKVVTRAWLVG